MCSRRQDGFVELIPKHSIFTRISSPGNMSSVLALRGGSKKEGPTAVKGQECPTQASTIQTRNKPCILQDMTRCAVLIVFLCPTRQQGYTISFLVQIEELVSVLIDHGHKDTNTNNNTRREHYIEVWAKLWRSVPWRQQRVQYAIYIPCSLGVVWSVGTIRFEDMFCTIA